VGLKWRDALRAERGDVAVYTALTAFALLTVLWSNIDSHRAWAANAVGGYALGVPLVLVGYAATRRAGEAARRLARLGVFGAVLITSVLMPMFALVALRSAGVPRVALGEVRVVEEAAHRFLVSGNPYAGSIELAAAVADNSAHAYNPYLPAMAVFGLPRAIAGATAATDVRIVFAACAAVLILLAFVLHRWRRPPSVRALQALGLTPLLALPVAAGGDDVPVLALLILGFALTERRALGWAGLAMGAAAAMKLTAWPVVAVLALTVLAMHGRRAGGRFLASAAAVVVAVVVPFAVADPARLVEHVLRFPLGLAEVHTPAASPLLGYWIERTGPYGHAAAMALLAIAGLGVGGYLLWRPPRSVAAAAMAASAGLSLAFVLAPSTRFGYFLYPLALGAWAALSRRPEQTVDDELGDMLREGAAGRTSAVCATPVSAPR
jgi:hypothetical protein